MSNKFPLNRKCKDITIMALSKQLENDDYSSSQIGETKFILFSLFVNLLFKQGLLDYWRGVDLIDLSFSNMIDYADMQQDEEFQRLPKAEKGCNKLTLLMGNRSKICQFIQLIQSWSKLKE